VTAGGNILAGAAPGRIRAAVSTWDGRIAAGEVPFTARQATAFGDGRAAERTCDALLAFSHSHQLTKQRQS
jgi:hypothetical protein